MKKLVRGFIHRPGVHCGSSALRDVFEYYGHKFSEDMIFGLGSGLNFVYWHMKRAIPPIFVGGRSRDLVGNLCQTLGVGVEKKTTSSSRRAWETAKELIDNDVPVMLQVEMSYLDYWRGKVGPFGGHMVVLVGYDEEKGEAYVTDVDDERIRKEPKDALQITSLQSLAEARSSKLKPFPPKNAWFVFSFPQKLILLDEAIKTAIKRNVEVFLYPPIKTLGIRGVRHFAEQIVGWPGIISGSVYEPFHFKAEVPMLKLTLFLTYVFIEKAGTGGGMFRRIYSRFLSEASKILEDEVLEEASRFVMESADRWTEIANILLSASEAKPDKIRGILLKARPKIMKCAEKGEKAFRLLTRVV